MTEVKIEYLKIEDIDSNLRKISTPLLMPDNDHITVYLGKYNDEYFLTDIGLVTNYSFVRLGIGGYFLTLLTKEINNKLPLYEIIDDEIHYNPKVIDDAAVLQFAQQLSFWVLQLNLINENQ